MDNVTHALAGCLFAAATVAHVQRRAGEQPGGVRRATVVFGVVMAEFPDVDLFYSGPVMGMGKLGYLLHHRGHTHTVVAAIAAAFLVWGLTLALRRDLRAPALARPLLVLALVGTLSHLALDYTNSYGVHPWWPIDNRWIYGDAVFIIEPWLWIVALPPLMMLTSRPAARAGFALLLAAIIAASWTLDMVGREPALALTAGAALWLVVVRYSPASRRVTLALVAWGAVEAAFFTASATARRVVRREVGTSLRDVALTPAPGNPFCWSALVVTEEAGTYRVTDATVAPLPRVRAAAGCAATARGGLTGPSGAAASPVIRWGTTWSAPVAELRDLAATNCYISAALGYVRVPIWRRMDDGAIQFSDLRYGEGSGSFASIVAPARPVRCPRHVPAWTWPRGDVVPSTR